MHACVHVSGYLYSTFIEPQDKTEGYVYNAQTYKVDPVMNHRKWNLWTLNTIIVLTVVLTNNIVMCCTYLHKINPQVFVYQKVESHHFKEITENNQIKYINFKKCHFLQYAFNKAHHKKNYHRNI